MIILSEIFATQSDKILAIIGVVTCQLIILLAIIICVLSYDANTKNDRK